MFAIVCRFGLGRLRDWLADLLSATAVDDFRPVCLLILLLTQVLACRKELRRGEEAERLLGADRRVAIILGPDTGGW